MAGRWQGPAHNPARLHSCRAFAPPIPTCPTPNASSLTLIPTALSASCLLPQLWPAPALSISRQTLELLARSARLKEADDELCLKQFTELVVLIKEVVDDRDELIAELERKLEKADRRAAQQRLANPAPPPQQRQPARAPAQHAALPVWDPAAVPMAAMSRLRAAEVSAAAAKAWAATAAAYDAAAAAVSDLASSQPAMQHTAGAEERQGAAAAWQAAYATLELARQACPDAPSVREAEAAVAVAVALGGVSHCAQEMMGAIRCSRNGVRTAGVC